MNDKRIRQLVIAVLLVLLALGLLSLIGTAFQLIVPLAILLIGGFAFYKIVLEGRDQPDAMADEIAESAPEQAERPLSDESGEVMSDADDRAHERLSALQRAQSEFIETSTPAEEILDQIKARRQRLRGDAEE